MWGGGKEDRWHPHIQHWEYETNEPHYQVAVNSFDLVYSHFISYRCHHHLDYYLYYYDAIPLSMTTTKTAAINQSISCLAFLADAWLRRIESSWECQFSKARSMNKMLYRITWIATMCLIHRADKSHMHAPNKDSQPQRLHLYKGLLLWYHTGHVHLNHHSSSQKGRWLLSAARMYRDPYMHFACVQ